MVSRCCRCGHEWADRATLYCPLCFPLGSRRAKCSTHGDGGCRPSPVVDTLDLDLSALRALEEIANG